MAAVDCPDVLPISGSDGPDNTNFPDASDPEPTPRPRALGKMKIVVDYSNYQDLPAAKAQQIETPFPYLSRYGLGMLPEGGVEKLSDNSAGSI